MGLQHRPANGRGSGKKEAKAATPSKSDMLVVLSQTPTHKLDPNWLDWESIVSFCTKRLTRMLVVDTTSDEILVNS